MLENFHDLIWYPLLGFLILGGLLDRRLRLVIISSFALLLVREDSGLLLFSIGVWTAVRRPDVRGMGIGLMLISSAWVFLVTGLIQPSVDASLSDRFLQEKFGHLVEDVSGGTWSVLFQMLQNPVALLQALVSPPGATLGFLIALSLPLLLVPLFSVDVALIVSAPLLIALLSQGRSYCSGCDASLRVGSCSRPVHRHVAVVAIQPIHLEEALVATLLDCCVEYGAVAHDC